MDRPPLLTSYNMQSNTGSSVSATVTFLDENMREMVPSVTISIPPSNSTFLSLLTAAGRNPALPSDTSFGVVQSCLFSPAGNVLLGNDPTATNAPLTPLSAGAVVRLGV